MVTLSACGKECRKIRLATKEDLENCDPCLFEPGFSSIITEGEDIKAIEHDLPLEERQRMVFSDN